jgi:hypothetical protein
VTAFLDQLEELLVQVNPEGIELEAESLKRSELTVDLQALLVDELDRRDRGLDFFDVALDSGGFFSGFSSRWMSRGGRDALRNLVRDIVEVAELDDTRSLHRPEMKVVKVSQSSIKFHANTHRSCGFGPSTTSTSCLVTFGSCSAAGRFCPTTTSTFGTMGHSTIGLFLSSSVKIASRIE